MSDTKRVLCYYRMSPDNRRMVFGGRARFTQVDPMVSAPVLYRYMTDRFPQLRGIKVTHAWTGNVAFTLDALPHNGTVLLLLQISGLTHGESYLDMVMTVIVSCIIALVAVLILGTLFGSF